jgi:cell wall-associated NlpC family hydrolase
MIIPPAAAWTKPYIGTPYHIRDCWRLCRYVVSKEAKIDFPDYADQLYESKADARKVAQYVEARMKEWKQVFTRDQVRQNPKCGQKFDVVVANMIGGPTHTGIVACPGWMLHTMFGMDSVCESFQTAHWKDRIVGIYRHESLC